MKHLILLCGLLLLTACVAPAIEKTDKALESRIDQVEKVLDRRVDDALDKATAKAEALVSTASQKLGGEVATIRAQTLEDAEKRIQSIRAEGLADLEKRVQSVRAEALADVDLRLARQRIELQSWVDGQRKETLADLDRQRKELQAFVTTERTELQAFSKKLVEESVPLAVKNAKDALLTVPGPVAGPGKEEGSPSNTELWIAAGLSVANALGLGYRAVVNKGKMRVTPEEKQVIAEIAASKKA